MKLKFILIFSFFVTVKSLNAQSYSELFDKNEIFSNPAYFGYENKFDVGVSFLPPFDFLEYKGFPFQIFSFAEISLDSLNSGFGITHHYDLIGPLRNWQLGLGYNYVFKINEKSKLRLGINTSFERTKLLASDLNLIDNGDDIIGQQDEIGIIFPSFDFGILYSYNNFTIGSSINNLIVNSSLPKSIVRYSITSSYLITIDEKNKIKTSAFFYRQYGAPLLWLVDFKYSYKNIFYVGTSITNDFKYTPPIRIGVTLFDCLDLSYGRTIKINNYFFSGYHAFSIAFKMRK